MGKTATEKIWFKASAAVICIAVTVFTLNQFSIRIQDLLKVKYDWKFELFMVLRMILFQYPFISKKSWSVKIDYYFNMLLVSLLGSVLLFPLLILNQYSHCSNVFNLAYFFCVVLIMFFVHKRRLAKLHLPGIISYTWILYRFLILIVIL